MAAAAENKKWQGFSRDSWHLFGDPHLYCSAIHLYAYLCKYPDSTIDDIYEIYGTPTNAVQYYLREQNEEDLKQLLSLRKWKRIIYACCITVPIALATVFSVNIWYWHDFKTHLDKKIEENRDDTATYNLGDDKLWEIIP